MIGAVILAAGRSLRMGRPKQILPWGETTVIGQVVNVLDQASVSEMIVVTGGAREAVEVVLRGSPARTVFNPDFTNGEMTRSLQIGLAALPESLEATLVVLGDQPQIEQSTIQAVLNAYRQNHASLVVPSYQKRRGHPWLVAQILWAELLQQSPPATLRDFLDIHLSETFFVDVETPSVLLDLDTLEDYQRGRPQLPDSQ